MIERRDFVAGGLMVTALATGGTAAAADGPMHGLIGKMIAHPGKREALAAVMLEGIGTMPGCLSYVVAADPKDANAIWVTEVWVDAAAHAASLELSPVKAAITKARPLIAGFGDYVTTVPLGGHGLTKA